MILCLYPYCFVYARMRHFVSFLNCENVLAFQQTREDKTFPLFLPYTKVLHPINNIEDTPFGIVIARSRPTFQAVGLSSEPGGINQGTQGRGRYAYVAYPMKSRFLVYFVFHRLCN